MELMRVLSIRVVRCVDCGDPERLITVTDTAVTSRCYVCGDITVSERVGGGTRAGGDAPYRGRPRSERGAAAA